MKQKRLMKATCEIYHLMFGFDSCSRIRAAYMMFTMAIAQTSSLCFRVCRPSVKLILGRGSHGPTARAHPGFPRMPTALPSALETGPRTLLPRPGPGTCVEFRRLKLQHQPTALGADLSVETQGAASLSRSAFKLSKTLCSIKIARAARSAAC
jgi:hypothetical protein